MILSALPTDTAVSLTFHCDPAHGWLEVSRDIVLNIGLKPTDFSKYSFKSRDGQKFYLEEDCDLTKFLFAYGKMCGKLPRFVDNYSAGESFVRRLPRL